MRLNQILLVSLLLGICLSGLPHLAPNAHAGYVDAGENCPVDSDPVNDEIWDGHPLKKGDYRLASWYLQKTNNDPPPATVPDQIVTAFSTNGGQDWVAIHKCVFERDESQPNGRAGHNSEAANELVKCEGWKKIYCLNVDRNDWSGYDESKIVIWLWIYDPETNDLREIGLNKNKEIKSDRTLDDAPGDRSDLVEVTEPPAEPQEIPHKKEIFKTIDELHEDTLVRDPDEMSRRPWTFLGDYSVTLGETICLEFDSSIDTVTVSWPCSLGGAAFFDFPDSCDACEPGFPKPDSVVRGGVLTSMEGDWLGYFVSYYSGPRQQQQQCAAFEWQLPEDSSICIEEIHQLKPWVGRELDATYTDTGLRLRNVVVTGNPQGCDSPTIEVIGGNTIRLRWPQACVDQGEAVEYEFTVDYPCEMVQPPDVVWNYYLIPTLTEWGLIIFGVVLLGFITWVFLRRRKAAAVSVVERS